MPSDDELMDFWRWAYSNLKSNAVRGVFAEYLVGRALNVTMDNPRVEWDAYDLKTQEGVTVEVKTGAYVQAWTAPERSSQVRYSGLLARSWIEGTVGSYSDHPAVRADVYVFALQTCRNPDAYRATDKTQWEFRVVPGPVVQQWGQRSVGLNRLISLGYAPVTYEQLREAVLNAQRQSVSGKVGDGATAPDSSSAFTLRT